MSGITINHLYTLRISVESNLESQPNVLETREIQFSFKELEADMGAVIERVRCQAVMALALIRWPR